MKLLVRFRHTHDTLVGLASGAEIVYEYFTIDGALGGSHFKGYWAKLGSRDVLLQITISSSKSSKPSKRNTFHVVEVQATGAAR